MSNGYNQKLYDQMDEAIWVTSGTRFLTYRKYKSIFNMLKFLNTFLAFILIVIGIYQIGGYEFFERKFDQGISIVLLICSIYIFSISFYLTTLEIKVKKIFDNAVNMSHLLRELKLAKNDDDLNKVSLKYKKLEHELNHDAIDYKKWCNAAKSQKYQNTLCEKIYYFLLWHMYSKFPILIFALGIILLYLYYKFS